MLNIIAVLAAAGGGLLVGMIITAFFDEKGLAEMRDENRALRAELAELKKRKTNNVKVIEINDNRAQPESYFAPF